MELVYASELVQAESRLDAAHAEIAALRAFVLKLAGTKPREGQWERSWHWLQDEARDVLAKHGGGPSAPDPGASPPRTVDMPAESRAREA